MTKSKNTKRALLASILSMFVCIAMLIGSTFAWFTDTATTAVNSIQSGTLDIDLVDESGDSIDGGILNFVNADGSSDILWEPGATYKLDKFKIVNKGNLALAYRVTIEGIDGGSKLLEVIDFTVQEGASASRPLENWECELLIPGNESELITITGKMKESAGNEYQGQTLEGVKIKVEAAQTPYESDSFDKNYDSDAFLSHCELYGHEYGSDDICKYCKKPNPFKNHHNETTGKYVINGVDTDVAELDIPGNIRGMQVEIASNAFSGNRTIESVRIGDGIEHIGSNAFENCTSLKTVKIPASVTSIDDEAFAGCSNITTVEIEDLGAWCNINFGNTHISEKSNPVCYSHNLYMDGKPVTEINLPPEVTNINNACFWNCNLESADLSHIETLGSYAFANSTIKSVKIGNNLNKFGSFAFNGCGELKSVEFESGCSISTVPGSAFNGCTAITDIDLPSTVTVLGEYAFSGCNSLKTINLDNIKTIGTGAFKDSGLTTLNLPKAVSIGESAFRSDNETGKLITVVLGSESAPLSNITISSGAFYGNINMTSVKIYSNSLKLNQWVFNMCTNLESIDFSGTSAAWKQASSGLTSWHYGAKADTVINCLGDNVKLNWNGDSIV